MVNRTSGFQILTEYLYNIFQFGRELVGQLFELNASAIHDDGAERVIIQNNGIGNGFKGQPFDKRFITGKKYIECGGFIRLFFTLLISKRLSVCFG